MIQIKLNQFKKMSTYHWLTNKAYLSAFTVTNILRVLPTKWRQKWTGVDMEQNYLTVTLCIDAARIVCGSGSM